MSSFMKIATDVISDLSSKFAIKKIFSAFDLKSLIKSSVVKAVKTVEQSFIDAADSAPAKTDAQTIEKMKKAAAFALAIAQLRKKGGAAKIVALFASSAVNAAIDEVKQAAKQTR